MRAANRSCSLLAPCFNLSQPTFSQFFVWNARQIRLDVQNWRAIEHVDTPDAQRQLLSPEEVDDSQTRSGLDAWASASQKLRVCDRHMAVGQ